MPPNTGGPLLPVARQLRAVGDREKLPRCHTGGHRWRHAPHCEPQALDAPPWTSSIQIVYTEEAAFEWDARKNAASRRNHGIDFGDAAHLFNGPIAEAPDDRDDREVRMIATRRIISARRATSNESQAYYQAIYGQAGV